MQQIYTCRDILPNPRVASKTAIIDGERTCTYKELLELASLYAGKLARSGVGRGDRVAIYSPRTIQSAAGLFGIWLCGGVGVFVNEVLKKRQVDHVLRHSDATILLASRLLEDNLADLSFQPDSIFFLEDPINVTEGLPDAPRSIGSDLAMLVYTSGSTGFPKGIMLSHDNLLAGARIVSDYLELSEHEIIISLLPFSFDYGLNQLLSALYIGGTLVLQRSVLPADICKALLNHKVTGMAAVPMLWQQLAHPRSPFAKTSFPHLRYLTNTGGRMPEHVTRLFRQAHPHVKIFLMYGLTEAFRSTYLAPEEVDKKPTSIGKAIPNVEILVLNEEGQECAPDEVGELVHRGETVSLGYWKDPEATLEKFRSLPPLLGRVHTGEAAVFSGDFVRRDKEGFLYYVGRKDQLIKSHGIRVSPDEIEEALQASQLISHAAVFATDNGNGDTDIIAAVVPLDPHSFRTETLHRFCKSEMPDYMHPKIVWPVEKFPLTTTGKPDRNRLKEQYRPPPSAQTT